jgi:hypothetical protein
MRGGATNDWFVGDLFCYGKFSLGAINYYSKDIINIFYTESKYSFSITKDLGALLAIQFADQRSTGDDLSKGRSFAANQVGVNGDMNHEGAAFTLGYTNTLRRTICKVSGAAIRVTPASRYRISIGRKNRP